MSGLRVLIVGASIAGPTAAYWFAKAGARVTVIERFPALRKGGQNIDIRSCGVTVMRRMAGMEAAVRAKSAQLEGMSWVDSNGKSYGVIGASGNPDQQSLISEYEIYRGDLAKILYDMTEGHEHVQYVFGEQVAGIQRLEKSDGPIKIDFANGKLSEKYDLVVACDGATSRTRAIGFDCGVRDNVTSMNCWSAYFSICRDVLHGSKIANAISAVNGRFISAELHPDGSTRIALLKINHKEDKEAAEKFRNASREGGNVLKQFVFDHFKDVGWRTQEFLRGMFDAKDFYASETVQVKLPRLHQGRFVLVGDAGYAPGFTGTGTSLALTGAYVLAGEINKQPDDLESALQSYEQVMKPIIKELSFVPPLVPTIMAPQTAWAIWLRNTIFAVIAWTNVVGLVSKFFGLFSAAFAKHDEYKLPVYDWKG